MVHNDQSQSPGSIIRLAMEAKGWTQADLAYALGTTTVQVNYILNDKRAVQADVARALSVALDLDPTAIVHAQADWELNLAPPPSADVHTRSKILSRYPLREMIKRGWIDPEFGRGSLEAQVCAFFDAASIDDVPYIHHAARKTSYDGVTPSQLAWLYRVRRIASEMAPPPFDASKLRAAIDRMVELRRDPDAVRYVPRLLNEAGVRFVVSEGLPNSNIDGACLWLDARSPVIAMSLRFDRIDNFWFVLRHECAHVLHGHGQQRPIVDADMDDPAHVVQSEEERIANDEAAEFCVPKEKMRSFYLRKNPYFADKEVLAFATRMEVHPGIVVGQLHRMIGRFDLLRKHLVKIRAPLSRSMMVDGWGDVIPVERG